MSQLKGKNRIRRLLLLVVLVLSFAGVAYGPSGRTCSAKAQGMNAPPCSICGDGPNYPFPSCDYCIPGQAK